MTRPIFFCVYLCFAATMLGIGGCTSPAPTISISTALPSVTPTAIIFATAVPVGPTFTPLPTRPSVQSGCSQGCIDHKPGCDIKGNISVGTGEKIYHVPGGRFYASTVIDPRFGERWFCTEDEAKANGWRKSSQ